MKKSYFVLLTLCLLLTGNTVKAQNDIDAFQTVLDSLNWGKRFKDPIEKDGKFIDYRPAIDGFLEELANRNKKNAKVLYAIGRSYWVFREEVDEEAHLRRVVYAIDDTAHAMKYMRMAIEADPKYSRPYILAARVMRVNQKPEEAMKWFERGLTACPGDQELIQAQFKEQARMGSIEDAIKQLEEMRKQNSEFPMELEIARLYSDRYSEEGGVDNAMGLVHWYEKAPKEQMTASDIYVYIWQMPNVVVANSGADPSSKEGKELYKDAMGKAIRMGEYGCQRFPKHYALHQKTMQYYVDLGLFEDALNMMEKMKNCEKYVDDPDNHYRLAQAYTGTRKYDKAEEQLKIIEGVSDSWAAKAYNQRYVIVQSQVRDLVEAKNYDAAITKWKEFIEQRKKEGKLDVAHEYNLFTLIRDKAFTISEDKPEERLPVLKEALSYMESILPDVESVNYMTIMLSDYITIAQHITANDQKVNGESIDGYMITMNACQKQIDYCESLPAEEKTSAIERRYANAYYIQFNTQANIYIETKSNAEKTAARAKLKSIGEKVLDNSLDSKQLDRVQFVFNALKIK